jgi:hypothetical protein
MTGEADPPIVAPSEDKPQPGLRTSQDPESWGYDDFLKEVDRMAAIRKAANRGEHDARVLSIVTLGIALAALGIALAALAMAAQK